LTIDEGLEALRAAASGRRFTEDLSLVRAALTNPRFAYLPLLADLYPSYSSMAQSLIQTYLGQLQEVEAAETYRDIIVRYATSGVLTSLKAEGFERKPRHANILFPAILIAADNPNLADDLYFLARAYIGGDLLDSTVQSELLARTAKAFHEERAWLTAQPVKAGVAWKWDKTYQQHRRLTIALINLFAVISSESVIEALTEALTFRDPVLVDTALHALAQRRHDLPDDAIARVAADPEGREPLYRLLKSRNELFRMPDEYRTQVALAESALVIWLCHPAELGSAPDEIELMEVVSAEATMADGSTGDLDYYMFRFRTFPPHWAADKGWLAGMAGPYLRSATPTTDSHGPTFSAFHPWNGKTAEDHAVEMVGILDSWRNGRRTRQDG
jgi:hypothetical protein